MDFIKTNLQKLQKILEDSVDMCIDNDNWDKATNLVSFAIACNDALELLKAQEEVKPTINEYGEAYCICGENVGIIPSSKNLPKICSKYCSECGRRMKWK